MTVTTAAPALALSGVSKRFDGFPALDGAHFSVREGEVHALLGENGAGKSSLMNVAAGLYLPDEGEVRVDGVVRRFSGPLEAAACRIGMVHQHYKLVRALSVAENVMLAAMAVESQSAGGDRSADKVGTTASRAALRTSYGSRLARIRALIDDHAARLGFSIDHRRAVHTLSVAEQQRVEILKALVTGARILILDEPTAVLTDEEATRLLQTMRTLAAAGAAVVLVTHRLRDVREHADRVTVMRAGRTVAECDPRATSTAELTELIVGAAAPAVTRKAAAPGVARLAIRNLTCRRHDGFEVLANLSLKVRSGEIYGVAGVGGNGQTELVEALLGIEPPVSGEVIIDGVGDIAMASPAARQSIGVAAIPADRYRLALAGTLPIADNYGVTRVASGAYGSVLWVDFRRMREEAAAGVREFDVQGVRRIEQPAGLLSGGNAQKLVIAREFASAPWLVVAHSPSRGLDVRACADVQRRLIDAREAGAAVLLVSEDLEEVLLLADRIGVMSRGRLVAEFDAPVDRQRIGEAMVDHA